MMRNALLVDDDASELFRRSWLSEESHMFIERFKKLARRMMRQAAYDLLSNVSEEDIAGLRQDVQQNGNPRRLAEAIDKLRYKQSAERWFAGEATRLSFEHCCAAIWPDRDTSLVGKAILANPRAFFEALDREVSADDEESSQPRAGMRLS